ncbi:hypothetical protein GLAREA_00930 [Glarea lozoyensis ATCC 20868]|uniref:DUF7707 domain-containing protein n=1 Tax=Glarea lozoyensis (strain ATCC 20868 / MF5171) TaxID=1116229 RepID=S3CVY1_GLAL2|nr:uncharacterized protein GLAREA_00930 [Glarea lozoyensis ATCC 20868]EPE29770.1 hypothetical protein GLAREA_00930 [Glarea lozoyensis ATCC 20868]
MLSFKTNLVVAALALCANAQVQYQIDPNSVSLPIRQGWCSQQKATCPSLCLQLGPGASSTTVSNTCDPATLDYTCVCGNGLSPNATEYSQTLPYFICTQYGTQCVAGCGGVNTCQAACRADHPCGAQDPSPPNATLTSTTASNSATATVGSNAAASTNAAGTVYNGLGGAAATTAASTSNNKSGAQSALDLGRSYGLATVFVGIFAGFTFFIDGDERTFETI